MTQRDGNNEGFKVLVAVAGVDDTTSGRFAVEAASAIARSNDHGELHIVHVMDDKLHFSKSDGTPKSRADADLLAKGRERIEDMAQVAEPLLPGPRPSAPRDG